MAHGLTIFHKWTIGLEWVRFMVKWRRKWFCKYGRERKEEIKEKTKKAWKKDKAINGYVWSFWLLWKPTGKKLQIWFRKALINFNKLRWPALPSMSANILPAPISKWGFEATSKKERQERWKTVLRRNQSTFDWWIT